MDGSGLIINIFSTVFCTNSFHQSVDFPVLLSVALVYLIELIRDDDSVRNMLDRLNLT